MRRALKRLGWALLVLGLLLGFVVVLGVAWLRSQGGQTFVRGQVVEATAVVASSSASAPDAITASPAAAAAAA